MDAKVHADPPPSRPPTRIQAANRELILEAALPVFSAFGFRGSTIDQIARGAGMSKPNLLYYFRTKEAIHRQLIDRVQRVELDVDPGEATSQQQPSPSIGQAVRQEAV